jgi:hypothetical protein
MKTNKDYKYAYRLATREVHRPAERPKKNETTARTDRGESSHRLETITGDDTLIVGCST